MDKATYAAKIRAVLIGHTPGLTGHLDHVSDDALLDLVHSADADREIEIKSGIGPNGAHCRVIGKLTGYGFDVFCSVRARRDDGREQKIQPAHVTQVLQMVK